MNPSRAESIDLYGVLKLERSATTPEIQRAYKSLSRHFHPDKRRDAAEKENAEAIFVRIKQAHDILSDRVLRFAYDHGGMIVVEMIKRSAAKAGMDPDDENADDKENSEDENYYEEIKKAKSRSAALKIVRNLLRAYEHHQASTNRTPLESTLTLNQCYHRYAPQPPYLASESTTMRLESSQPLTKQMDLSINCTSQVQRTSTAALTTQVGLGYRPDVATQWHAFCAASTTGSLPQVTLQTTRRLYDKSTLTVGAGGSLAGSETWACTLASSRVILLGSLLGRTSNVDDAKLHASWRLGLGVTSGQLQSLMAQIRTTHFPQWTIRIGLGGPMLKVSYNHAAENSFHCTYSWHWLWWKAKVTKEDPLDDYWSIRYGIKYDFRGAFVGQPWSLLVHLHSDEWTLHLPIDLIYGSEWPVTSVLTFLAARWLDDFLESYTTSNVKTDRSLVDSDNAANPFREVVQNVGQRKRTEEEASNGLVFLTAVWKDFSSSSHEDVTDLLQYWTVQGQLCLVTSRARWSAPWTEDETVESWWLSLGKQLMQRYWLKEPPIDDYIYVRYQYRGKVYEIEFRSDEKKLVFPNSKATLMGDAGCVL